ncbi:hypothetical protein ACF0H5_018844 [Mactra antiquata]
MRISTAALCLLFALLDCTISQNVRNVALHCRVVPSPGRCSDTDKRALWSYSTKVGECTQLYGCYGIRDRNVFQSRALCERSCFTTGNNDATSTSYLDCEVNPSPGLCRDSEKRTYFTFSSKINACVQINGCYTIRDKNIFLSRDGCRRICILNRPDILPDTSLLIENTTTTEITVEVGYTVAVECTVNPSAGACLPSERKTFYTYSSKSGSCVQIYGCYSVRDRNVFMSRDTCRNNCILKDSGNSVGNIWNKDPQCYINPSPGRCLPEDRQSMWTFSSKTNACQQLYGCYSVRDRNVFRTLTGCKRTCVGPDNTGSTTGPSTELNIKIALECRINPSAGVCQDREKNTFYSYSSKTGDCIEIFGCYSVRDRNVYVTKAGCRRSCFLSDEGPSSGIMESQCYVSPSPGRCLEDEKRTYFTYSTKINACVRIYGCYGIRDRNVFLTRVGCQQACSGDIPVRPVTPAGNFGNVDIVPLPGGADYTIAPECRINPSPGICNENQKRFFYTYSSKSSSCVQIFGCYNIRDRNVFLRRDGCRRYCYVTGTSPSGVDTQCYINPTPGRCRDSEKRNYWSYSSKTMSCTRIFGCYSIRDRNIFLRRDACQRTCIPNLPPPISTTPIVPISQVNPGCKVNPSPGRCSERDRRTFFSYSSKTHRCTEIYGCYSIRDRNVFLTRDSCQKGCFEKDTSGSEPQCSMNPSPGKCAESQRRTYFSYSSKTSTCLQIYGCYSIRDRNVFMTREGCRRRCEPPAVMPPIDTSAKKQVDFVDVRGSGEPMVDIRNAGNGGTNMVDIRNGGGGGNMVDIRNSGNAGANMVDIRNGGGGGNMVDIRNSGNGGANMVDIRNGGGGGNMVDIRNSGNTMGGGLTMEDIRSGRTPTMVDIRNGRLNMVDIRKSGNSANMVDIRNGGSAGGSFVDIRGGNSNMVDIRGGSSNANMVDIRQGGSNNMIDIRNGQATGGNMVDIRNSQSNTDNMVDIRSNGNTNFVDVRNGASNMVDIRNNAGRQTNFVDVRSNNGAQNMVDVRGNNMIDIRTGKMIDIRQGRTGPNMVDIRSGQTGGNMVDIRQGRTGPNMVDIRSGQTGGNMVDIRQGQTGPNMVDIRSGQTGANMVDIRQGQTGPNMVDIRQGRTGPNMVDIRSGQTGANMVDIRQGQTGPNMVDIRQGRTGPNMVDIRSGQTGANMVDIRQGQTGPNMVDIRNTMVDIRSGQTGDNLVDIRSEQTGPNMVDIRSGQSSPNMVDVRSKMVDIRSEQTGPNMVDIRSGQSRPNMIDIRNRQSGANMVDIRGNKMTDIRSGSNMVDIRSDQTGPSMVDIRGNKMVDIRAGQTTPSMVDIRNTMVDIRTEQPNMVDVRSGQTGQNMVDIRGNKMVDIRSGQSGDTGPSMVDIRGNTMVDIRGNKMVDIRNTQSDPNMVDIRGNKMVDIRSDRTDPSMVDIRNRQSTSNMVDIRRNKMVDIRNGNTDPNMIDIRNGATGPDMVDIRGRNMVDLRGNKMVDIRGSNNDANMVDIMGTIGSDFVDIRNTDQMVDVRQGGNTNNMVDVRENNSGNFVDVRGSSSSPNMVDIRQGTTTNFVDVRGGNNMVDIRGTNGASTSFVDVRSNNQGARPLVDIRNGGTSTGNTNFVDVRNGQTGGNMVDIRGTNGNFVDIRGGNNGINMVDIRNGRTGPDMVDIRQSGGQFVDVRGGHADKPLVDIRSVSNANQFVDIRNGRVNTNMVDIRDKSSTNFVDVRGGTTDPTMVDIRGNTGSQTTNSFVDIRNGQSGSKMVDIRNGRVDGNMVDIRGKSGNFVDIRNGQTDSGMVDIRGNSDANMVDVRGTTPRNFVDIRGKQTSMTDIRNAASNNFVDIRNGQANPSMVDIRSTSNDNSNFVDIRSGTSGQNMVDIRGNRNGNTNFVDVRGGGPNFVDVRGGGTNFVDVRGGGSDQSMVDIRSNSGSNFVDVRGQQNNNMVDIRGDSANGGGFVDIRGNTNGKMVDIRDSNGNMIDIRGTNGQMVDIRGNTNGNMVDIRHTNGKMVDIRGANGNMVDIRGANGNMVDIRGNTNGHNGNMVDIRDANGNMVDIRGNTNGKMVDIRGPNGNMVDIRGNDGNMIDIRGNNGNLVDIRGNTDGKMVDIRGNTNSNMVDIRGNDGNMVDIRGNNGDSFVDIRNGNGNMVDIRGDTGSNFVDIRGGSTDPGMVDIRGGSGLHMNTTFIDIRDGSTGFISDIIPMDPQSLTDLPIINIAPGIRIARECLINPTPGLCLENQQKSFWTFSTKSNSCTKIMGCFDIHDRNTWLSLDGCRRNCLKNDSEVDTSNTLPLECQLNPTPGRCLPSEERTVWIYNTKLGACTQLEGCYDFHDRNVWSSRARCRSKCRVTSAILAPEIPYNVKGIRIHPECHINPSPGRCTDNQQKTFWTFSSKASACTRVTGCYNIRDRNTWRSRDECKNSCLVNSTDVSFAKPLECKLVPAPGRCLDSQKKSVYTYSDKLGICVEITGCYDFHDRNVWRTHQACNDRCHVNTTVTPDLTKYDIALECQLNPIPGRCQESQKRSFYSFSGKAGGCVEIYGCYTINDRNVWYTRDGCQESCLLPKPGTGGPTEISQSCIQDPVPQTCLPNQRNMWYTYSRVTKQCERIDGCYRLGDNNIFINKRRCETGCFSKPPEYVIGGIARECRLNPTPGVCGIDERRSYWSYSQKTGTCVELTGCYTIRDRNIWLTREMCNNNCIKRAVEPRSEVLPNFLAGSNGQEDGINGIRRGRRGRILTRNNNRNPGGEVARDLIITRIDTFDVSLEPVTSNTGSIQTATIPPPPQAMMGTPASMVSSNNVMENLFLLNAANS